MNKNLSPTHSYMAPPTSISSFCGGNCRCNGLTRAVALVDRIIIAAPAPGMADAVQESIEDAFGKTERDVQPEGSENIYKLNPANFRRGVLTNDNRGCFGKPKRR